MVKNLNLAGLIGSIFNPLLFENTNRSVKYLRGQEHQQPKFQHPHPEYSDRSFKVSWLVLEIFFLRKQEVNAHTLLKSLIQPRLNYCSQLWSPADQTSINKIESVRQLIDKIKDHRLSGLTYCSGSQASTPRGGAEKGNRLSSSGR